MNSMMINDNKCNYSKNNIRINNNININKNKNLFIMALIVTCICILKNVTYAAEFNWPLEQVELGTNPIYLRNLNSSGVVSNGYHAGWDMVIGNDNPYVYAVSDGVVTNVVSNGSGGNYITIRHDLTEDIVLKDVRYYSAVGPTGPMKESSRVDEINLGNTIYSKYMHLASGTILVSVGDKVKAGMPIAIMGNTGNSTGNHLHFYLGSASGPTKNWNDSLIFTAEGNEIANYNKANMSSFSEFSSGKSSPNNLCLKINPKQYAIAPNYIFGYYETVDVDPEEAVDTIKVAAQLLERQKAQGYNTNSRDPNFVSVSGPLYYGMAANLYSYKRSAIPEEILPKRLTETATGKKIKKSFPKRLLLFKTEKVEGKAAKRYNFGNIVNADLSGITEVIADYAGAITAILVYVGILGVGIGLILKRRDPEGRANLISSLLTIGIGALMVSSAYLISAFFVN